MFPKIYKHESTFFGNVCLSSERWTNIKEIEGKIKFQLKSNQFIKTFFLCKIDTESIFVQSKFCLASKHNYGHKKCIYKHCINHSIAFDTKQKTEKISWK